MTEKILEPRGIRDEIIDILKTVDKYGYCLDSDIEWQADRIMEAYAAQQSKMPTDAEIHDKAYDYCITPSMPEGEPEADMQVYEAFCDGIEWLRNQIG